MMSGLPSIATTDLIAGSKSERNLIKRLGASAVLTLLCGYFDLRSFAISINDLVSDTDKIRSPAVAVTLMDCTCMRATSLTSTIGMRRSGTIGSLPRSNLSTKEIEDPKLLSNGAPNTSAGLITVSSISGAWFLMKSQAACSAKVLERM